jgi:hypothetical protein
MTDRPALREVALGISAAEEQKGEKCGAGDGGARA